MKLTSFFVLVTAASCCIAQSDRKPSAAVILPAPASSVAAAPAQGPSQAEMQKKLQEMLDRTSQSGCPVTLTSAELTPYLLLLRTSSDAPASQGGVDLQFRNTSGKEIRSIELRAEFLAKKSIYDLRATKIDLHLTANGTSSLDESFDHLRHLSLPQRTHPVVLSELKLEQVTFADGSVWSPAKENRCGFSPNGEMQIGTR